MFTSLFNTDIIKNHVKKMTREFGDSAKDRFFKIACIVATEVSWSMQAIEIASSFS